MEELAADTWKANALDNYTSSVKAVDGLWLYKYGGKFEPTFFATRIPCNVLTFS